MIKCLFLATQEAYSGIVVMTHPVSLPPSFPQPDEGRYPALWNGLLLPARQSDRMKLLFGQIATNGHSTGQIPACLLLTQLFFAKLQSTIKILLSRYRRAGRPQAETTFLRYYTFPLP
ncbi:MAG: hypothetical protein R6V32_06405 [Bacteroidales bacterium]